MPTHVSQGLDDDSEAGGNPTLFDSELDPELVEKLRAETVIQAGFTVEDEDGNVRANEKQLPPHVLQLMLDRHVATNKRDFATRAVTKFELYQEVFPDGPGAQSLAQTPEEREVQSLLMKLLWGYLSIGPTGHVQKNVASEGVILCEGDAKRTKINEETGKRQPTTERARFLTADRDLIMTYYTSPAGAAFMRAARRLDAQLGLVSARRPELAVPVARQLNAVVRQAVAAVPHADVKQVNALTGGDADTEASA